MRRLAEGEEGFGLIELLIAMTVMVVAIMAIIAGISSGMVALNRASRASTAATLADIQMEGYRMVMYVIAPTCALGNAGGGQIASRACRATQTGPVGRGYRIDSYVRLDCAVGTLVRTVRSALGLHPAQGLARPRSL